MSQGSIQLELRITGTLRRSRRRGFFWIESHGRVVGRGLSDRLDTKMFWLAVNGMAALHC